MEKEAYWHEDKDSERKRKDKTWQTITMLYIANKGNHETDKNHSLKTINDLYLNLNALTFLVLKVSITVIWKDIWKQNKSCGCPSEEQISS